MQGSPLVHAPLAEWARTRGGALAISNGKIALTYAELDAAVSQRAQALTRDHAPANLLIDSNASTLERVVEFLAIVSSGRCAAVADPDWPPHLHQAVRSTIDALPTALPTLTGDAPFYIGFTSGTTGRPKGFRRSHASWVESFEACLATFGSPAAARMLAPGSMSHSLFLFAMLLGIWSGGGVVVQEQFSAARVLDTLRLGKTPSLIAVPSQLLLMIELATRRRLAPMEGVRLILISGARWARDRTPELQALFPKARMIEFYGASETSFVAWMNANEHTPTQVVGYPFPQVAISVRDRDVETGAGLIFVRSPMLFMDYVGAGNDSTAALRDGPWLSVCDMGYLDAMGRLCLVGRHNRMIVTQGKNLFPEELEAVLAMHEGVVQASVHGLRDALRGMQVAAVLQLAPAAAAPSAHALSAWCRERLEAYKGPRRYFICRDWPLTSSGKTDHAALGASLQQLETQSPDPALPCLAPLSS